VSYIICACVTVILASSLIIKASLLRLDLWRLQSCKRLWVSNHIAATTLLGCAAALLTPKNLKP